MIEVNLLRKATKDRRSKPLRMVVFLLLIFLVLGIGFQSYMKNQNQDIKSMNFKDFWVSMFEEKAPIEKTNLMNSLSFISDINATYQVYRDYMVEASTLGIRFLDKNLNEKENFSFAMNQPLIRIKGPYIVVADMKGKNIQAFRGTERIWNQVLDENILSFDLDENGFVAINHQLQKYRSGLTILDPTGKAILKMGTVNEFIMFTRFEGKKGNFVVNKLDSSNIELKSTLEFFQLNRESAATLEFEDFIIGDLEFLRDGSFVVFGNDAMKIFDRGRNEVWAKNFIGELFAGAVHGSGMVVLARSFEDQNGIYNTHRTLVELFERENVIAEIELEDRVMGIKTSRNSIGLFTKRKVYILDRRGRIFGEFENQQDIKNIDFLDDRNFIVVGRTSVNLVKVE
jgi:hypothetical protein